MLSKLQSLLYPFHNACHRQFDSVYARLGRSLPFPFLRQSYDGAVEPQGDTDIVVDGDAAKLK